jgi:tripartite-type tricarboxylate transporter receptor subunit TctC
LRRLTLFAKGNLDVRDSLHALRLGGELPAPVDPPGTSISSSLVAVLAALCIGGSAPALAQTFPARTVKITAPYSAGAAPAVFTRALADKLSKAWGQPVIVESKPGASGFVAIEAVKAAPADGHELLVVSDAHVAINPSLYKSLPYDPQKDFVPVAMFYHTPFYLAVASAGPYASVPALIAAAKANPGTVSYGSSYVGSPSHLGSAEFEFTTGTKMIHVPYRDQSQMYVGIANGDVGWAFTTLGSALPLMQAGRIKLIAIAAAERSKVQPDVPTLAEAGGPASMRVGAWLAIVAPRGTPADVVRRINADVNKVLADPEVLTLMRTLGFEPTPETPEQFADEIRADARRYGELVRRTGATAD